MRTLKNETYKHMTVISKNVYISKLDKIVDKYNNTSWNNKKKLPVFS